jgi:hypothetical protein
LAPLRTILGLFSRLMKWAVHQTKRASRNDWPSSSRGERIRTSDLIDPNDARYQAALLPDSKNEVYWIYRSLPNFGLIGWQLCKAETKWVQTHSRYNALVSFRLNANRDRRRARRAAERSIRVETSPYPAAPHAPTHDDGTRWGMGLRRERSTELTPKSQPNGWTAQQLGR